MDFLGLLSRIASADGAFGALFGRAAGSDGLYRLMELCDRYLYEPWSPMRSDELYAAALRAFTESPCIAEIDKVRARQALERLSMNRPGTPAADFIYVDRGGSRHRLSDIEAPHILLFFHYPGCGECRRMKAALEASPIVGESLRRGRLASWPYASESGTIGSVPDVRWGELTGSTEGCPPPAGRFMTCGLCRRSTCSTANGA